MEEIYRRIPHRPPFLFIDQILEITNEGASAKLSVKPDFSFFTGHYPGNPIMPVFYFVNQSFKPGQFFFPII